MTLELVSGKDLMRKVQIQMSTDPTSFIHKAKHVQNLQIDPEALQMRFATDITSVEILLNYGGDI